MFRLLAVLLFLAHPLRAEPPQVVTDIPPIHALVSMVMGDLGTPDLVVGAGSSPHHHAMRPSEARMLSQADVVIWVGPSLTRWLKDPIETLAQDATVLKLMDVEGMDLLPFREGAMFEGHDHASEKDHDHEAHGHTGDDHEGDDNEAALDPHIWLGPENAKKILIAISGVLAEVDPENASVYLANAMTGQGEIASVATQIDGQLAPVRSTPFVVLHDGFHYFEAYFDIEAFGAIAAGDAQTPGAVRMTTLRAALKDSGVQCAFTEPGVGTRLLETATEGLNMRIGTLDPLGVDLAPGPELYLKLLRNLALDMAACLAP